MSKANAAVKAEFFDSAGNLCVPREDGTLDVISLNTEPSMTIQSDRDSCDVQAIIDRFTRTGVMSNIVTGSPLDISLDEVPDFQTAQNMMIEARDAFMKLPAKVRKHFDNEPAQLLDFMADESNREEAIRLGLIEPPQTSQMSQGGSQSGETAGDKPAV